MTDTTPAAAVVDTHTHVLSTDTDRYPRAAPGGGEGAEPAWYDEEPVTTETLLSRMSGAGVDAALLVQAMATYGTDNRYVLDSARTYPLRCAAIGALRLDDPDPATALRRMIADDGGQGVRLLLGHSPPEALADPRLVGVLDMAAELDTPVVLAVSSDQMPGLGAVIRQHPSVRFALDHCGFPMLDAGPPWPDAAPLFALAGLPNLTLKVTSMVLQAAAVGGPPSAFLEQLVAEFGAGRMMWGSDFPHTRTGGYAGLLAMARTAAAGLDRADQDQLFGLTALKVWPALA